MKLMSENFTYLIHSDRSNIVPTLEFLEFGVLLVCLIIDHANVGLNHVSS